MSVHLIALGDDMVFPVQFVKEHPRDLLAYADRIDTLAGGALRGAATILRRGEDKAEEAGSPRGAVEAVEAAEFLRELARMLRESASQGNLTESA
jgi:hypothetical protein